MNKLKATGLALLLATSLTLAGTNSLKSKNFYYGVNTTLADTYKTGDLDFVSRSTLGIQGGVTLLREGSFEAGIEGRYSTQVDNLFDVYSTQVFVKPAYNVDIVEVYGLLGYGYEGAPLAYQDGVAYGFGAGIEVSRYNVFVDYVEKDNTGDAQVTVGMNYKF